MAKLVKKQHKKRRYRRNPDDAPATSSKSGGGIFSGSSEIFEEIVPAAVAFAATRFATRIASMWIAKRWPNLAKHAGAMASVGAFLTAWQLGHKIKYLQKYQEQATIGSGIATVQSLFQIYLPKVGWIMSDASPEVAATAAATSAPSPQVQGTPAQRSLPPQTDPDFEEIDDSGWFSYNDAHDAGRFQQPRAQAARTPMRDTSAVDTTEDDESVFDALESSGDLQSAGGIFG